MTHRSRSGGPQRGFPGRKPGSKKKGPKLNHPPAHRDAGRAESDGDEAGSGSDGGDATPVLPASAFLDSPTDLEVLQVLRSSLSSALDSPDFSADVQKVKSLLYDRKWLELFTDPALLDAYAGRWVPSRALCFRELMAGLKDVRALFAAGDGDVEGESEGEDESDGESDGEEKGARGKGPTTTAPASTDLAGTSSPAPSKHILAIGGGAGSELLAVAALLAAAPGTHIKWTGADIGDWSGVLDRIEAGVRDKWAVNATFDFVECDVLAPAVPSAAAANDASSSDMPAPPAFLASLPSPDLTTIFFTLTELLSQNRARTVALLRALTAATPPGGHLLVADSASDIAEFPLGRDGRTWPVYMVLDALVLQALGKGQWARVRAADSAWFRLDDATVRGARWPCKLENARYWIRMYRRV